MPLRPCATARALFILSVLALLTGRPGPGQDLVIVLPNADQPFCATETFDLPVQARVDVPEGCEAQIHWSIDVEGRRYTATTAPDERGILHIDAPPTRSDSFGPAEVHAVVEFVPGLFTGTGEFAGEGALRFTGPGDGTNYEGYIVSPCTGGGGPGGGGPGGETQSMAVGQRTDEPAGGKTNLIRAFCTDAYKAAPSHATVFGTPWTSTSTTHWAYWTRQAVTYGNEQNAHDLEILEAVWYISDRTGVDSETPVYNRLLAGIGYPRQGPIKNVGEDHTPPSPPQVTDEGDTTRVSTELRAAWTSEEPESGISEYVYSIGTEPGAGDVVDWTSAGGVPSVTHTGLLLAAGTYYITVRARNGAGLWSESGASDGIVVVESTFGDATVYGFPNPFSPASDGVMQIVFFAAAPGHATLRLYDASGELVWQAERASRAGQNTISWDGTSEAGRTVARGVYFYTLQHGGATVVKPFAVIE